MPISKRQLDNLLKKQKGVAAATKKFLAQASPDQRKILENAYEKSSYAGSVLARCPIKGKDGKATCSAAGKGVRKAAASKKPDSWNSKLLKWTK